MYCKPYLARTTTWAFLNTRAPLPQMSLKWFISIERRYINVETKKTTWWSFKEKHTLTCVMQSPIITWVGVRTIGKHSDTSLSNAFPPRIQKLPFQHLWFLQIFAEILHKSSGWGSNLSFIGSPPKMQVTLVEQCGNAALRSERCDEMVWNTRMICLDGFRKTWVTVT